MKLYSKKGEFTHELISGIGIVSSEAKVTHKQKQIMNGNKRSRMETKKEQVFNTFTKFEKIDANKKARQSKYEYLRKRKK